MQIRTALRIETTDMADARHMSQALNLVGGKTCVGPEPASELRPFRVIDTNDFTLEDVEAAVLFIRRRRDALRVNAAAIRSEAHDNDFDRRRAETMADGIKANADHAVRLAEQFLADVRSDLASQ